MIDPEKLVAWKKLCEPQEGDFENFKSEYQVRRINTLRDSLLEAIEVLNKLSNEASMRVFFYDRKNKRQVSSHELMPTKVVAIYMTALGTLAYKSDQKWDLFCNVEDLIFLDIES